MTAPMVCPNCGNDVTRKDEHRFVICDPVGFIGWTCAVVKTVTCTHCDQPIKQTNGFNPHYDGKIGTFNCPAHDWRAEALKLRGDYDRGFAAGIEAAAKVGESYGYMCRQIVVDTIRALTPPAKADGERGR
jgi:endogenous inhibitor of DNA gyrase (YacG/DUF329 family)